MMKLVFASANDQADQLLELLCEEIQITDTQYDNAKRSYQTVGDWLGDENSVLNPFSPDMFAQGSMALGTVVKPRQREDFDVDLVCLLQLDADRVDPVRVFNLVHTRIMANATYAKMAEVKERCIRLNYAGEFHLDIIPACPRPRDGHEAIVIPDREKRKWIETNPKGYKKWLASRAVRLEERRKAAASVQPLPPNAPAVHKTPLQRSIQLFKRRRDVAFNGGDRAPKSILLTTLAGQFYNAEDLCTDALVNILDRIAIQAQGRHEIPTVPNPTNPAENFARHWQDDPSLYFEFLKFCAAFKVGMQELIAARGLPRIEAILNELFDPAGTGVATRAIKAYTERFEGQRQDKSIRMKIGSAAALTTAAAPSIAIPANKFFGD